MQKADSDSVVLQMFAKYPEAGRVKTRLQTILSPQEAANFHSSLVLECVQRFIHLPERFKVELWGDRPAGEPYFRQLLDTFPRLGFRLQQGGDLGDRMAFAFRSGLSRFGKVILIGTDCPELDLQAILQLERALEARRVNLIAAEDGGYVAIGSCTYDDDFFYGKDWGSDQVLRQTLDSAERLGWQSEVHGCLWDVDDAMDYARYQHMYGSARSLKGNDRV